MNTILKVLDKKTPDDYQSRVLICESDKLIREIISLQVGNAVNAEVFETDNGLTASKILKMRSFDLIIANIFLPGRSGLEITEFIRSTLKKSVPIILLTPDNQEQTLALAYELGADDFVMKPYNINELNLRARYLTGQV